MSSSETGDRPDSAEIEDDVDNEPDLDDIVGAASAGRDIDPATPLASRRVQEAWVTIDGKKVHKATVLRLYSNPMAVKDSKDRLKRVRGFSQYHEIPSTADSFVPDSENPNTVHVQDPALTLVKCNKQIFLAVFQILSIRVDGKAVLSASAEIIAEPNVRISGQVMKLSLFDTSHQPDGADWQWIGNFEKKGTIHSVPGRSIELINPLIQRAERGRNSGQDTYVFRTAELRALSAVLYQKMFDDPGIIPEVPLTPTFPYRSAEGQPV